MIHYETESYNILFPNFKVFSKKAVEEIIKVKNNTTNLKPIAIDMGCVYSVSSDFLDMINTSDEKIILINTPSDVMVLLNLTNSDKNVKLFCSALDLEEDKRELVNRKFSVI